MIYKFFRWITRDVSCYIKITLKRPLDSSFYKSYFRRGTDFLLHLSLVSIYVNNAWRCFRKLGINKNWELIIII
jgi:hypothetical protein